MPGASRPRAPSLWDGFPCAVPFPCFFPSVPPLFCCRIGCPEYTISLHGNRNQLPPALPSLWDGFPCAVPVALLSPFLSFPRGRLPADCLSLAFSQPVAHFSLFCLPALQFFFSVSLLLPVCSLFFVAVLVVQKCCCSGVEGVMLPLPRCVCFLLIVYDAVSASGWTGKDG